MATAMHRLASHLAAHLRRTWADQRELDERQALIDRPWEENYLHWSFDGGCWRLHGTLLPPQGRRRSVTTRGWCPGLPR